jgi:DNA polymerase-3 subunit beta
VPAAALRAALQRTLFAAGAETSRYSLHGVLWELEPDRVRLVATDNRRLAVAEVPAAVRVEHLTPARRLVPVKAMDLLARVAEGHEGPVQALFGPRAACFRVAHASLGARYVEGDYPAWRKAVPARPRHRLAVPVGPLLAGVRQAAALREREDARLLLRFEPGRLTLESRQAGAGRSRVQQRVPFFGGPMEVALNPKYLVDLLRALDAESTLQMELTDPDTVVLFRDGEHYQHALMPMRPA